MFCYCKHYGNEYVHSIVCVYEYIYGWIPGRGISPSKGICTCDFDRCCQIALSRGCSKLPSHQQCARDALSPLTLPHTISFHFHPCQSDRKTWNFIWFIWFYCLVYFIMREFVSMGVDWDPADTHPAPSPPCSGPGGLTSKNDCITPALSSLVSCGQDEEERKRHILLGLGLTDFCSALGSQGAGLCPQVQHLSGDPLPWSQLSPRSITSFSALAPLS